jgi:hypothetical protein
MAFLADFERLLVLHTIEYKVLSREKLNDITNDSAEGLFLGRNNKDRNNADNQCMQVQIIKKMIKELTTK